jgi:hypothetical protein
MRLVRGDDPGQGKAVPALHLESGRRLSTRSYGRSPAA